MCKKKRGEKQMTIYFDMDGTIANLYGVDGWIDKLNAEDVSPYLRASPMLNMAVFARMLHTLQAEGIKIGIISWNSKSGSKDYNRKVELAKLKWLTTHLRSVQFDEIHILDFDTPKWSVADEQAVLFDDNKSVRIDFANHNRLALDVGNIINDLKTIITMKGTMI
jgi:hypothetical protein